MKACRIIIMAGAIVALAAPALANAKIAPAKQPKNHSAKKHVVKPLTTRQGHSRVIYIYSPGPVGSVVVQTQQQYEEQYNQDLIEHGLDPVVFPPIADTSVSEAAPSTDASLAIDVAPTTTSSVATTPVDESEDC